MEKPGARRSKARRNDSGADSQAHRQGQHPARRRETSGENGGRVPADGRGRRDRYRARRGRHWALTAVLAECTIEVEKAPPRGAACTAAQPESEAPVRRLGTPDSLGPLHLLLLNGSRESCYIGWIRSAAIERRGQSPQSIFSDYRRSSIE